MIRYLTLATTVMADAMQFSEPDFLNAIEGAKPVMVMFHAPWCGHCKHLMPVYDELDEKIGGNCTVAKIDATEEQQLASSMEVQGYPTIMLIADRKVYEYQGGRTSEELEAFCTDYAASGEGKKLPQDKSHLDNLLDFVKAYSLKIDAVSRFDELLLPTVFAVGCLFGAIFVCVTLSVTKFLFPRKKHGKKEKRDKKARDACETGSPVEESVEKVSYCTCPPVEEEKIEKTEKTEETKKNE